MQVAYLRATGPKKKKNLGPVGRSERNIWPVFPQVVGITARAREGIHFTAVQIAENNRKRGRATKGARWKLPHLSTFGHVVVGERILNQGMGSATRNTGSTRVLRAASVFPFFFSSWKAWMPAGGAGLHKLVWTSCARRTWSAPSGFFDDRPTGQGLLELFFFRAIQICVRIIPPDEGRNVLTSFFGRRRSFAAAFSHSLRYWAWKETVSGRPKVSRCGERGPQ